MVQLGRKIKWWKIVKKNSCKNYLEMHFVLQKILRLLQNLVKRKICNFYKVHLKTFGFKCMQNFYKNPKQIYQKTMKIWLRKSIKKIWRIFKIKMQRIFPNFNPQKGAKNLSFEWLKSSLLFN